MTAAAVAAVIWPLRRQRRLDERSGNDAAVYRDQLDEIERDEALGRIGKPEAEAIRAEISRRLIAASDSADIAQITHKKWTTWHHRAVAIAALLLLPVSAVTLYLKLGSPEFTSGSLEKKSNIASADRSTEKMIAQVETYLAANPQDGKGWEVLGPVYLQTGRVDDAVKAHRNALNLLGPTAARLGDLGEAIVLSANGLVTAEAKALFDRAAVLDPDDVMAKYYLGLAAKQDGRREEAEKAWRDLLARAPQGAPWIELVQNALARIDEKTSPSPTSDGTAGQAPPPDHGSAAIQDMVNRLAERLKNSGSDPEGWVKLVRSYTVLGENDKAIAATADARRALADDPTKLQQFNEALKAYETGGAPEPAPTTAATGPQIPTPNNEMIRGMVDRLAARLKQDGSDLDGWVRLVRSYMVLGELDKARAAATDARNALAKDADKLRQFDEAAKELGVKS